MKHTRPGKIPGAPELDKYEDEKLCVVECFQEYVVRTEAVRKGNDKLLLSYVKPHGSASKDTISRSMKNVLRQAGIVCCDRLGLMSLNLIVSGGSFNSNGTKWNICERYFEESRLA